MPGPGTAQQGLHRQHRLGRPGARGRSPATTGRAAGVAAGLAGHERAGTGPRLDDALGHQLPDGRRDRHRRGLVPGHQLTDRGQPVAGRGAGDRGPQILDNASRLRYRHSWDQMSNVTARRSDSGHGALGALGVLLVQLLAAVHPPRRARPRPLVRRLRPGRRRRGPRRRLPADQPRAPPDAGPVAAPGRRRARRRGRLPAAHLASR